MRSRQPPQNEVLVFSAITVQGATATQEWRDPATPDTNWMKGRECLFPY